MLANPAETAPQDRARPLSSFWGMIRRALSSRACAWHGGLEGSTVPVDAQGAYMPWDTRFSHD
jgi:hypothetical protein